MHFLLTIQNVKFYIKISSIRSYMFQSTWTILRELTLSLAKLRFCRINQSKHIVISFCSVVAQARLSVSSLRMVRVDRSM